MAVLVSLLALGCEHAGEDGPGIESLTPNFGWGGDTVTVRGEGFAGPLIVKVGGYKAVSVEYIDVNEFRMEVPSNAEGLADVSVMLRDGSRGEKRNAFSYQDPSLSPQVAVFSPTTGLHEGDTEVTLSGGNFHDGIIIYFQGVPCTQVQVLGLNIVTAVTPGMPLGCLDVVVENIDGRKAWLPQAFTSKCLTPDEQYILDFVNQERAYAGLAPLTPHPALCIAARLHCQDMIDRDFFDHENPDGLFADDRVASQGYVFETLGENIAAGTFSAIDTMNQWMASPSHSMNILDLNYQEIGIGHKIGGLWGVYWTQLFAKPRE
jgi:uncharacterized protein YkwD